MASIGVLGFVPLSPTYLDRKVKCHSGLTAIEGLMAVEIESNRI